MGFYWSWSRTTSFCFRVRLNRRDTLTQDQAGHTRHKAVKPQDLNSPLGCKQNKKGPYITGNGLEQVYRVCSKVLVISDSWGMEL